MADQKNILMLARDKKVEALRMASGLTLLDDHIGIVTLGSLPDGDAAAEQLEALEFAEVPMIGVESNPTKADMMTLAARIIASDVVYCV